MQLVINSTNINTFFCKVTFDIWNRSVTFDFSGTTYNGSGAASVLGISMSLIDQSGLELAGGLNFGPATIPGPITGLNNVYTLDLSSVNFAFLFQTYQITVAIQDAGGTVYTTTPVYKTLCQPNDLSDAGYVPGCFQIIPDTINSVLTVKELTQLVYNALTPVSTSKSGTLSYPTGTISSIAFSNTPFSNNVIYTGEYRIVCTTIGVYSLQDDVYINVSYYTNNVFDVVVSNKMADLFCCIQKVQQTALKHCNDAIGENARNQMAEISTYLMMGFLAESSGQDSSFAYDYIKKYLSCNCGNNALSQSEFTPINPSVTSIVLNGVGGTTIPSPVVTGNTQTYNIQSSIYQVAKGNTGDLAFTISQNTSILNTVQYLITFNYDTLAGYVLTAIGNNPVLISQLQNLVSSSAFSTVGLNGNCVIDLTTANYSMSQAINVSTYIVNIVINGIVYPAPSNLFANNQSAVSLWLTSLSLGSFAVTSTSSNIGIVSSNNPNVVSTMTFTGPGVTTQFQSYNASLTQILQAIINYLCGITALQVELGNNLSLCTFDYNGNVVTTNYLSTASQGGFNSGVAAAVCNIANRIKTLTGVTCATLQDIFSQSPNASFDIGTDSILGFLNGVCVGMNVTQLVNAIIAEVNANSTVKAAWCAINCATPGTCPDISNINIGLLSNTSIGIYGVTFTATPSSSQTTTLKYRVTGTSTWLTASNNLVLFPNGNVSVSSPFVISGLSPNTSYDVWDQNNCGGTGYIKQVTTPANTLYSGSFLLDNSYYLICGDAPVTLYSSLPFASGVTMYTNAGLTTPVTGFTYIVQQGNGYIYTINTSTGVVGINTQSSCLGGTLGTYAVANSTIAVCSAASQSLYTNGSFAPGGILYYDSGLTTPVTGNTYVLVVGTNHIYNLNTSTGQIGSDTGIQCSTTTVRITSTMAGCSLTNVTGITGFTPSPAFPLNPGGTVTGTHSSFTGAIACTITGTPIINPSNITLTVNGTLRQCINVTAAGTFTFSSLTYLSTDVITISLNTGSC